MNVQLLPLTSLFARRERYSLPEARATEGLRRTRNGSGDETDQRTFVSVCSLGCNVQNDKETQRHRCYGYGYTTTPGCVLLLITELNGMYLGFPGTLGASFLPRGDCCSLRRRFTCSSIALNCHFHVWLYKKGR